MVPAVRAFFCNKTTLETEYTMPKKQPDGRWRGQVCWTDHISHPDRPKRQKRVIFETKNEAIAWEKSFASQIHIAGEPLTDEQTREYQRAISLLPDGMALVDAIMVAREVQKTKIQQRATLADAAALYLKEKYGTLTREKSITDVRQKVGRLTSTPLASQYVDAITPTMLLELLSDMRVSGTTRNNYRKHWKMFFTWCVHAGYAVTSPANAITRSVTAETIPPIFTSEQVKLIFNTLRSTPALNCLLHYQALAFFAGIRPTELKRLDFKNIDLESGKIRITPDVAKTRAQGYIDIHPVLAMFLKGCPVSGMVWPHAYATFRRRHKLLVEIAGVIWSPDVARHSYASHLLAQKKDAAYVRFQLRHDSADVLYRHYIAIVTTEDAIRYFDSSFYS